jgi:hypothetical protein
MAVTCVILRYAGTIAANARSLTHEEVITDWIQREILPAALSSDRYQDGEYEDAPGKCHHDRRVARSLPDEGMPADRRLS